jgi:hypothetical protein
VQAKTDLLEVRIPFAIALSMLSNISSSDLSSPIHNTKSACLPLSAIDVKIFSATEPLLIP